MTRNEALRFGRGEELVTAAAAVLREDAHPSHQPSGLTLHATHRGYDITVSTKYAIVVDGQLIETPLVLNEDGIIGAHVLPTRSFTSPLQLAKALIEAFPQEFPAKPSERK
jgi:hypothetical protein